MYYIEFVREDNGKKSLFPASIVGFIEADNETHLFVANEIWDISFIPWPYNEVLEAVTQSKGFVSFPIRDNE